MKFKTFTISVILCCFAAIISLESCECYNRRDSAALEPSYTISFRLLDKDTKQNLITFGGKYNFDSVQVYDANWVLIYPGPVPGNGWVGLRPYFGLDALIPLEKDTTEYYYLHLIEDGLDIDTIRADYRAYINECDKQEFTYLNIYFNDELINASDGPTDGYYVELFK